MCPFTGADRPQDIACLQITRKLGVEHPLPDDDQLGVVVGKLVVEKGVETLVASPLEEQAGITTGDQLGVESLRRPVRRNAQHASRVAEQEGRDNHLLDPPEKRTVVPGEHLHDGEVATDEDHENRPALEQPVPQFLQRAVQAGIAFEQPRQLVQDHDRRSIGRQCRVHRAQSLLPVAIRPAHEQVSTWQGALQPRILDKSVQVPLDGCLPGAGNEQTRQAAALHELADQTRLASLASPAHTQQPRLARHRSAQVTGEPRHLLSAAHERRLPHEVQANIHVSDIHVTNISVSFRDDRRDQSTGPIDGISGWRSRPRRRQRRSRPWRGTRR